MKEEFNNLMIFENKNVEVFEFKGQVLFNPYDVGKCLELTNSAVRKAINKMSINQAVKLKHSIVKDFPNLDIPTSGKLFLTEQGVYKLAFQSNKPEAEKFANWVFDEVLPSIRKHGVYIEDNIAIKLKENPNYIIELIEELNKTKEILRNSKEDIEYANLVSKSKDTISFNYFAKFLQNSGTDIGRNRMMKILRQEKILQSDNTPYQKYMKHFVVKQELVIQKNSPKIVPITQIKASGQRLLLKTLKKYYSNLNINVLDIQ